MSLSPVLEEKVKVRAYELYLKRGGAPGNDHADWYTAEQEVREGNGHGGTIDASPARPKQKIRPKEY